QQAKSTEHNTSIQHNMNTENTAIQLLIGGGTDVSYKFFPPFFFFGMDKKEKGGKKIFTLLHSPSFLKKYFCFLRIHYIYFASGEYEMETDLSEQHEGRDIEKEQGQKHKKENNNDAAPALASSVDTDNDLLEDIIHEMDSPQHPDGELERVQDNNNNEGWDVTGSN
ncbi:hypothetical protein RFI_30674, partial [Reticulomyxa filosa]